MVPCRFGYLKVFSLSDFQCSPGALELFIAILKNQAVGFQLADEAKDSMHLIDEAALSTSSEQQRENDKDAK